MCQMHTLLQSHTHTWAAACRTKLFTSNACWMKHFKSLLRDEKNHPDDTVDEGQDYRLVELWDSRQQSLCAMYPEVFDLMRPYKYHAAAEEIIANGGGTACRDWCLTWVSLPYSIRVCVMHV